MRSGNETFWSVLWHNYPKSYLRRFVNNKEPIQNNSFQNSDELLQIKLPFKLIVSKGWVRDKIHRKWWVVDDVMQLNESRLPNQEVKSSLAHVPLRSRLWKGISLASTWAYLKEGPAAGNLETLNPRRERVICLTASALLLLSCTTLLSSLVPPTTAVRAVCLPAISHVWGSVILPAFVL